MTNCLTSVLATNYGWQAQCRTCGWHGPADRSIPVAEADRDAHLEQIPSPVRPKQQVVVRHPDSRYEVRTYEGVGDRWKLVKTAPASFRDVVQATLDGRVADAEVTS